MLISPNTLLRFEGAILVEYLSGNGPWRRIFAVPTEVVEKHIKMASGVHLKVLLIVLCRCEAVDVKVLSETLGLAVADVKDALHYWVEAGILYPNDGAAPVADVAALSTEPEKAQPAVTATSHTDEATKQKVTITRERGKLSKEEINKMSKIDPNIALLLQEAQGRFGKTFSSAESEVLVFLYSYFNLSPDYILMAMEYCKSIEKDNMRCVEKTVTSWVDAGIMTHDAVEKQIKKMAKQNKQEKTIKASLKIYDRDLTAKERQFIAVWTDDWHFTMQLIKLAFERTVDNTGKLSFPYMNKILETWFQKGIKTPQEAEQEIASKPQTAEGESVRSYDIDKLEWMMLQETMSD